MRTTESFTTLYTVEESENDKAKTNVKVIRVSSWSKGRLEWKKTFNLPDSVPGHLVSETFYMYLRSLSFLDPTPPRHAVNSRTRTNVTVIWGQTSGTDGPSLAKICSNSCCDIGQTCIGKDVKMTYFLE